MRYVVDASVAVRWFITEFQHPNAEQVKHMMLEKPGIFSVPELFFYETLAVLYRYHPNANTVFDDDIYPLIRSGVLRYPMTPGVYSRVNKYVLRGLTGYDATYLALAEELDAMWLTFDSKADRLVADEGRSIDLNGKWNSDTH